jgi:hypothetical protein
MATSMRPVERLTKARSIVGINTPISVAARPARNSGLEGEGAAMPRPNRLSESVCGSTIHFSSTAVAVGEMNLHSPAALATVQTTIERLQFHFRVLQPFVLSHSLMSSCPGSL